jgi:ATP-dependent DNA helicase RecG
LPDYDLTEAEAVKITVYGGVVSPAYTWLLMQKTDLPLTDILALDRVQKNLPVPERAAAHLKRAKLIEGRRPHLHVSALIAAAAGNKATYIRRRALDDAYYAKLLTELLRKFGTASRAEINQMLVPKLSETLTEEKKLSKINNLLTKWRKSGLIRNLGSDRTPRWALAEKKE